MVESEGTPFPCGLGDSPHPIRLRADPLWLCLSPPPRIGPSLLLRGRGGLQLPSRGEKGREEACGKEQPCWKEGELPGVGRLGEGHLRAKGMDRWPRKDRQEKREGEGWRQGQA